MADEYKPGDVSGGSNGMYAVPAAPTAEKLTTATTVEGVRAQHDRAKSSLEAELKDVYHGTEAMPHTGKDLERKQDKLTSTGINLDHVPVSLQSAYVALTNLINTPDSRLMKKKESIEDIVGKLGEIESGVTVALYGANYTGISGKLGGLHKEYQQKADDRLKCAQALTHLKEEIKATYGRIDSTKQLMAEAMNKDHETVKTASTNLVGYGFDLNRFEGIRTDLEGDFAGYDQEIKALRRDIDAAARFRNHLRQLSQTTRNALKVNKGTHSEIRYTQMVSKLIPDLQDKLKGYIAMIGDFRAVNNSEVEHLVSVTQETVTVPTLEEEVANPFKDAEIAAEQRSEEISQRVDEILKDPFSDVYGEPTKA